MKRRLICMLLLLGTSCVAMHNEKVRSHANTKKTSNSVLLAKGYLVKALIHKVLLMKDVEASPYELIRGLWNFLVGEGQFDLDNRIKKLEESAVDYPPAHACLCKAYLMKAKKLLREAKNGGNLEAMAVARVISDYDLEGLLVCKPEKKTQPPAGLFM